MKKQLIKNIFFLYGLSFVKIVFPLLTMPYLMRVLSVDNYGVISYVKSIISYIQIIIDFAFILSGTKDIVNAKGNNKVLNNETFDIMLARILLSVISFVLLSILVYCLPLLKGFESYVFISFIAPFLSIFLFDYVFRGMEKMEVITIRVFIVKTISTLLTFVFVKNDNDILAIPIIDALSSIVAVVMAFIELKKINIVFDVSKLSLRRGIKKIYTSFDYFISNVASIAFNSFNTLLIGIYLSKSEIAFWSICIQIISTIQNMYNPIIDGIYPEMIKSKNIKTIKSITKIVLPIIFLGCVFVFFVANHALVILGGEKYRSAGVILRTLTPVLFFSFLSMLLGWPTLGVISKPKTVVLSTIISSLFHVAMVTALILFRSLNLTSISIARNFTEIVLFSTRLLLTIKYKDNFNYEQNR